MTDYSTKPESYWQARLSPEQYRILRQAGTEPPFTGTFNAHHAQGTYTCGACGQPLFSSESKYDSDSGWPSFWQALDTNRIKLVDDFSHGMHRIEVRCAQCGSHLGHLFDDGPQPTGQHYCINSGALGFEAKGQKESYEK